jgi:hypothetical protein
MLTSSRPLTPGTQRSVDGPHLLDLGVRYVHLQGWGSGPLKGARDHLLLHAGSGRPGLELARWLRCQTRVLAQGGSWTHPCSPPPPPPTHTQTRGRTAAESQGLPTCDLNNGLLLITLSRLFVNLHRNGRAAHGALAAPHWRCVGAACPPKARQHSQAACTLVATPTSGSLAGCECTVGLECKVIVPTAAGGTPRQLTCT